MSMYSRGGESSSIPDSCGEGKEITRGVKCDLCKAAQTATQRLGLASTRAPEELLLPLGWLGSSPWKRVAGSAH